MSSYEKQTWFDRTGEQKQIIKADMLNHMEKGIEAANEPATQETQGAMSAEDKKKLDDWNVSDATADFDSGDASESDAWEDVGVIESGSPLKTLFGKLSTMVKNVRYLYKLLGTTDISQIADGTLTGAVKAQDESTVYCTQDEYDALGDSKLTDGKLYFISDGGVIRNGVRYASLDAMMIAYDNATSGMAATTVQDAVDELGAGLSTIDGNIVTGVIIDANDITCSGVQDLATYMLKMHNDILKDKQSVLGSIEFENVNSAVIGYKQSTNRGRYLAMIRTSNTLYSFKVIDTSNIGCVIFSGTETTYSI